MYSLHCLTDSCNGAIVQSEGPPLDRKEYSICNFFTGQKSFKRDPEICGQVSHNAKLFPKTSCSNRIVIQSEPHLILHQPAARMKSATADRAPRL